MPYVIGLTGGIASGKTTIANLFHRHFDIGIVDADVVARDVVMPGTPGLNAIVEHFGQDILDNQGALNRKELRSRIFSDREEQNWLNNLLHPLIREKMTQELDKITTPYVLLVVPLLVENQLQSMANRILVIDVDVDTQIARTIERDKVSREQVDSIISAQASRKQRLELADDVIVNNDDTISLLPQIKKLHEHYMALCEL
jgi:dephospho-CoA kinase